MAKTHKNNFFYFCLRGFCVYMNRNNNKRQKTYLFAKRKTQRKVKTKLNTNTQETKITINNNLFDKCTDTLIYLVLPPLFIFSLFLFYYLIKSNNFIWKFRCQWHFSDKFNKMKAIFPICASFQLVGSQSIYIDECDGRR